MIIGGPTTRIIGVVALIAAGGCGAGSGRPTVTPPAASPAPIPPDAASPVPVMEAKEGPPPVPVIRRSFDAPLRARPSRRATQKSIRSSLT